MFRFKRKQKFEDEPLWLFKVLALDTFQNKQIQLFLNLMFVILTILTASQTLLFLQKSDIRYFLKYQAMYFTSFFILLSVYAIPKIGKNVTAGLQLLDFWPINAAGADVERRITFEAFYYNAFSIVTTVIALLSGVLHALPLEDDAEIFYTLAFFEEYFPQWSTYLCFLYRLGFVIVAFVMPAPCYLVIYLGNIMKFQAYMVMQIAENVNDGFEMNLKTLVSNLEYQKKIKKNLTFIAKRYNDLMSFAYKARDELKQFVFYFSIAGTVLFISVLLFIFTFEGSFKGRYLRIATLLCAAGLVFTHIMLVGQGIEDMTSEGFNIIKKMDWICWNKENKQVYLLLLANTQNPFKLKFTESLSVNYSLAVSMARSVYSVISVLGYSKSVAF